MAASACWLFAVESASAQDVGADPPEKAKDPPEAIAAEPPPEPAPAPPEPPTPVPAPAPSAAPSPDVAAPTVVTLEETPEEPPKAAPRAAGSGAATKPRAQRRRSKAAASPPRRPPEHSPASTGKRALAPSPASTTSKGGEPAPKAKEDDSDGPLGPFRIGALVGVGLPSILSFGGMIKLTRYVAAGLNLGLIPAVKLSLYGDAELSYQEYDLYGRLFPFGGDLFLGAGVGYASINGSFSSKYDVSAFQRAAPNLPSPLLVASEGSVRTLVLTPTAGILHTFGIGFTFGVDLGAQIPIAPSTTQFKTVVPSSVPPQVVDMYVKPNDKKVQDTLDTVGRTILPTLNLRVGWLI